jgi:hypothetical protein
VGVGGTNRKDDPACTGEVELLREVDAGCNKGTCFPVRQRCSTIGGEQEGCSVSTRN